VASRDHGETFRFETRSLRGLTRSYLVILPSVSRVLSAPLQYPVSPLRNLLHAFAVFDNQVDALQKIDVLKHVAA